ncbi:MAG TPA: hypothetical protein VFW62_00830 [bacterium]|nr:hypothetical protein [bacterium]HKY61960.1 hypothetical protein [bacterium]
MKRFALLAAVAAVLFSVQSFACEGDKKHEGKDKAPQAQTETPSAPVATTQTGK